MPRPRRAIGYARVSSLEQAQGSSLQDQQNSIAAYAKTRGLTVAKFYVEAESGIREKQERRTQLAALMREAREGDLVIVSKLDRWSRDTEHTLTTVRLLDEKGVSFYAIDDSCDPSTRDGHMMMTMRAMMAREEHARIRLRTVGTRKLLRDQGYYVEGKLPLGYVRPFAKGYGGVEKNVLAIDPDGAAIVRRVFGLCIRGAPIIKIAAELELGRDQVNGILHSRIYLGEIANSQGTFIKGKHDPIIDATTFAKAHAAMAARTCAGRARRGDSESSTWILRDIARCARCGSKMSGAFAGDQTSRRHYYRCYAKCTSHYVSVALIESEAEALVLARLGEVRDVLAAGGEVSEAAPVVDYAAKLEKVARRRERALEEYEDEHITRDELRAKLAKIDAERARIENEAAEATKPSPLSDVTVRRDMIRSLGVVTTAWQRAKKMPGVRRQIVTKLAVAAKMAAGTPLRFVWRSAEDLVAHLHE